MRLFLAALIEIAGLGLLAASAFILHPAAGIAATGIALVWFGAELAGGRAK